MKKIISTLLIAALTFSFCVSAQSTIPFSDVSPEHWAYDAISYFYSAEVINGMNDTIYAPDENISREQLAKLLSVLFGKTATVDTPTFVDVPKERWSYPFIESVKAYLTGYFPAGGTPFFNPAAKATREDIAYALVRISGYTSGDSSILEAFSDAASVSPKLVPFVAAAVENGLLQGYNGMLRPQEGITRAEAAMLLFRAIKQPVNPAPEETEKPGKAPASNKVPTPTATPTPSPKPEKKEPAKPVPDDATLIFTDFQRISGYRDNAIKGELRVSFDSAAPQFSADLKCYEGLGYTLCEIRLNAHTAVSENSLEGYFTFSLDGTPRHTRIKGTVILSDGVLTLHTEEYDYHLVANAAPGAIPMPEKNASLYSMILSAKNTDTHTASGILELSYNEDKSHAALRGEITVDEITYAISSESGSALSPESITGTFSVTSEDSSVKKSVQGILSGLDSGLGGHARFKTDDGTLDVLLLITEIAG